MKMITKAIEKRLPKLYTTEGTPTSEKRFVFKFFTPWSDWTWYVLEGEYLTRDVTGDEDDWRFFGYVEGFEKEWGYFHLSQLTSVKGPMGLKIERDYHFNDVPVSQIVPDTYISGQDIPLTIEQSPKEESK